MDGEKVRRQVMTERCHRMSEGSLFREKVVVKTLRREGDIIHGWNGPSRTIFTISFLFRAICMTFSNFTRHTIQFNCVVPCTLFHPKFKPGNRTKSKSPLFNPHPPNAMQPMWRISNSDVGSPRS